MRGHPFDTRTWERTSRPVRPSKYSLDGIVIAWNTAGHVGSGIYRRAWRVVGQSDRSRTGVHRLIGSASAREGAESWVPSHSGIEGSKHTHMRELRVQHEGRPYRILYAFDPRRCAILLLGGDKTGDDRWYDVHVPIADKLYDTHIETLRKEGQING